MQGSWNLLLPLLKVNSCTQYKKPSCAHPTEPIHILKTATNQLQLRLTTFIYTVSILNTYLNKNGMCLRNEAEKQVCLYTLGCTWTIWSYLHTQTKSGVTCKCSHDSTSTTTPQPQPQPHLQAYCS